MADILLQKPQAGQVVALTPQPEDRLVFEFEPGDALLERAGDNLTLSFNDGSSIELTDFYVAYTSENMPEFVIGEAVVPGEAFFAALSEDLMPAAGPGAGTALGSGNSVGFEQGSLLGGLTREVRLDQAFGDGADPTFDTPAATAFVADTDGAAPVAAVTTDGDAPVNQQPVIDSITFTDPPIDIDGDGTIDVTGGYVIEAGDGRDNLTNADLTDSTPNQDYAGKLTTTGQINATDPEGDPLTYGVVNPNGQFGSVAVNASNGSFVYTMYDENDPLYSDLIGKLNHGEVVTETFIFTVSDGINPPRTEEATITIVGTNDQPELSIDKGHFDIVEDAENPDFVLTGTSTVSDPDNADTQTFFVGEAGQNVGETLDATDSLTAVGSDLTVQLTDVSSGRTIDATVSVDVNGKYTITVKNSDVQFLGEGETATGSFTIYVQDGEGAWASQDVSIKVTGTNDVPQITSKDTTLTTDDSFIAGGTNGTNEPAGVTSPTEQASGSITFTSAEDMNNGIIEFAHKDDSGKDVTTPLTVTQDTNGDWIVTPAIVDGQYGSITNIVLQETNGEFTLSYDYIQDKAFNHDPDSNDHDAITTTPAEKFEVSINDSKTLTGESLNTTTITVNIEDDGPKLKYTEDEMQAIEQSLTIALEATDVVKDTDDTNDSSDSGTVKDALVAAGHMTSGQTVQEFAESLINFGADGEGSTTISYSLSIQGDADSGFTSGGKPITLVENPTTGVVEGLADLDGDGTATDVIFSVSVDQTTGEITLTQQGPIDHTVVNTFNPDGTVKLNLDGKINVSMTVTGTDKDGDSVSETIDTNVSLTFHDTTPKFVETTPTGGTVLDESLLSYADSQADGTNATDANVDYFPSVTGTIKVNFGADGAADGSAGFSDAFNWNTKIDPDTKDYIDMPNIYTVEGVKVVWTTQGDKLIGTAGVGGEEVITVEMGTIDANGEASYTVTLKQPIKHDAPDAGETADNNQDLPNSDDKDSDVPSNLEFGFTITDRDGDTDDTGSITVQIQDDAPELKYTEDEIQAIEKLLTISLETTDVAKDTDDTNDSSDSDFVKDALVAAGHMTSGQTVQEFAESLINFGVDGEGSTAISYSLSIQGDADSGFTSGGKTITLVENPTTGVVEGLADLDGDGKATDVIFSVSVDQTTGEITLTQQGPIDHTVVNTYNPDGTVKLNLDGKINVSMTVTGTDKDGDSVSETIDTNVSLTFHDTTPEFEKTTPTGGTVLDESLLSYADNIQADGTNATDANVDNFPSVTGTIKVNFGADGAADGSAGFSDAFNWNTEIDPDTKDYIDMPDIYTVEGVKVVWTTQGDTLIGTAGVGGEEVITVEMGTIDANGEASYTVTLKQPIKHDAPDAGETADRNQDLPNSDDKDSDVPSNLEFGFTITDRDGDTDDTGSITVQIQDDILDVNANLVESSSTQIEKEFVADFTDKSYDQDFGNTLEVKDGSDVFFTLSAGYVAKNKDGSYDDFEASTEANIKWTDDKLGGNQSYGLYIDSGEDGVNTDKDTGIKDDNEGDRVDYNPTTGQSEALRLEIADGQTAAGVTINLSYLFAGGAAGFDDEAAYIRFFDADGNEVYATDIHGYSGSGEFTLIVPKSFNSFEIFALDNGEPGGSNSDFALSSVELLTVDNITTFAGSLDIKGADGVDSIVIDGEGLVKNNTESTVDVIVYEKAGEFKVSIDIDTGAWTLVKDDRDVDAEFTIKTTDKDGDMVETNITLGAEGITVDESGMPGGTNAGDGSASVIGSLTVANASTFEDITNVKINDTVLKFDKDGKLISSTTEIVTDKGIVSDFSLGTNSLGEVVLNYKYTGTEIMLHDNPTSDDEPAYNADSFTANFETESGISAVRVDVDIKDDGPVIKSDANNDGETEGTMLDGNVTAKVEIDFGADGYGQILFPRSIVGTGPDGIKYDAANNTWVKINALSDEHPLEQTVVGDTHTIKFGDVTFEYTEGDETWTVSYPNNSTGDREVEFTVVDGDGDSVSHTITSNDSVPTFVKPETNSVVEKAGKVDGYVNDNVKFGLDGKATSDAYDVITPEGWARSVTGDVVTLTDAVTGSEFTLNQESGQYTFETTDIALNKDFVFKYTAKDGNGTTAESTITIEATALQGDALTGTETIVKTSVTDIPLNVAIVVDSSGSAKDYMSTVETALKSMKIDLDGLVKDGVEVNICLIDYDSGAWIVTKNLSDLDNNLWHKGEGGTNVDAGLSAAEGWFNTLPQDVNGTPVGKNVTILLADGHATFTMDNTVQKNNVNVPETVVYKGVQYTYSHRTIDRSDNEPDYDYHYIAADGTTIIRHEEYQVAGLFGGSRELSYTEWRAANGQRLDGIDRNEKLPTTNLDIDVDVDVTGQDFGGTPWTDGSFTYRLLQDTSTNGITDEIALPMLQVQVNGVWVDVARVGRQGTGHSSTSTEFEKNAALEAANSLKDTMGKDGDLYAIYVDTNGNESDTSTIGFLQTLTGNIVYSTTNTDLSAIFGNVFEEMNKDIETMELLGKVVDSANAVGDVDGDGSDDFTISGTTLDEKTESFIHEVLDHADQGNYDVLKEVADSIEKTIDGEVTAQSEAPESATLNGTVEDDVIVGFRDHETIYADEGHDVVFGGAGNDIMYGEEGNDFLYGGSGDDVLYGGDGDDALYGGAGDDLIVGLEINDLIVDGGDDMDVLLAGANGLSVEQIEDKLKSGEIVDTEVIVAGKDLKGQTVDEVLDELGLTQNGDKLEFKEGEKDNWQNNGATVTVGTGADQKTYTEYQNKDDEDLKILVETTKLDV